MGFFLKVQMYRLGKVVEWGGELLPGKGGGVGWEVVTWERGWGGVGSWCLFRRQGANCCIPVEIEEILTYTQIKNAETFAVGQSCVANSPCTLSTNLD